MKKQINSVVCAASLALLLALPSMALAHNVWMRPSQTVLSGDAPWVTVDAAVSNDLFFFNHHPLRLDNLQITAPNGQLVSAQNASTGRYRSVFDVELTQQGTYRIAVVNRGLMASWKEGGQSKRWRGDAQRFANEVPANAQDLEVSESVSRIETFVTRGNPDTMALAAQGVGLELQPITHPNDLVAGESARFRLLLDGQAAANVEVEIIRGQTRYRDALESIQVSTDNEGVFTVTWPQAGMYWLEARHQDARTQLPQAKQRRLGYTATLEVLTP